MHEQRKLVQALKVYIFKKGEKKDQKIRNCKYEANLHK